MTITGLSGDIGSGKSWKMLHFGLEQANFKQKYLVTNFALNLPNLKRYCAKKKFWWVLWCIDNGYFAIVSFVAQDSRKENLSLVPFFKDRQNSICILDEAGIFLNSRNFANTPAQLLMDLAQSRKSGNDLIWAAQFDTQVDVQFRNLTQFWIHCDGMTAYDKKMRRPKLVWKTYFHFKGAEYQRWLISAKARTSFIRTYFAFSFKTDFGPLSKTDVLLFSAFDSFTRLENQQSSAKEISVRSMRTEKELINANYYQRLSSERAACVLKRNPDRWVSPQERRRILLILKILAFATAFKKAKFTYPALGWYLNKSIRRREKQYITKFLLSYREPDPKPKPQAKFSLLKIFSVVCILYVRFVLFISMLKGLAINSRRRVPRAGAADKNSQTKINT